MDQLVSAAIEFFRNLLPSIVANLVPTNSQQGNPHAVDNRWRSKWLGFFLMIIFSVFFYNFSSIVNLFNNKCEINVSKISIQKRTVKVNELIKASVRADNPEGQAMTFNWQAVNGNMNPGLGSPSSSSTYTAPPYEVNDTISVDVTMSDCNPVRLSTQISVITEAPIEVTISPTLLAEPIATPKIEESATPTVQVEPTETIIPTPTMTASPTVTVEPTETIETIETTPSADMDIWEVSYYNNIDLRDDPIKQATETLKNEEGRYLLQHNSADISSREDMPNENWSARFKGTFYFSEGNYHFHCEHSNACRVDVDGKNWINAWPDQPGGHDMSRDLSSGNHTVVIEYYDKSGVGVLEAWWELNTPTETPPTEQATSTPTNATPTPEEASGLIAFASDRDDDRDREIYTMKADGTDITQITYNSTADYGPQWSPNGKQLVFYSNREGNDEIYVMNSDGSGLNNLTNHPNNDVQPRWSPDGKKVAFSSNREGNLDIYIVNVDGTGITRLTDHSRDDWNPSWSPNGEKIAFVSKRDGNEEIYVMDVDGTSLTNLTRNDADDSGPMWSPDGNMIAFHSNRVDDQRDIFVMNYDDKSVNRLTNEPGNDQIASWSPDGSQIIFESWRDGDGEIYKMRSDGTGVKNLTNHPSNDLYPSWQRPMVPEQ